MAATTSNHGWLCYYAARAKRRFDQFHRKAHVERWQMIKRNKGHCVVYGGHYEFQTRPPDFDHFYRLEVARSTRARSEISLLKDYCDFHSDTFLGDIEYAEFDAGASGDVALPCSEAIFALGTEGKKCRTKEKCEAEASAEPADSTPPSTAGADDAKRPEKPSGASSKAAPATRREEGRSSRRTGKVIEVTYENMDETGITPGTFEAIFDRARRNGKR